MIFITAIILAMSSYSYSMEIDTNLAQNDTITLVTRDNKKVPVPRHYEAFATKLQTYRISSNNQKIVNIPLTEKALSTFLSYLELDSKILTEKKRDDNKIIENIQQESLDSLFELCNTAASMGSGNLLYYFTQALEKHLDTNITAESVIDITKIPQSIIKQQKFIHRRFLTDLVICGMDSKGFLRESENDRRCRSELDPFLTPQQTFFLYYVADQASKYSPQEHHKDDKQKIIINTVELEKIFKTLNQDLQVKVRKKYLTSDQTSTKCIIS